MKNYIGVTTPSLAKKAISGLSKYTGKQFSAEKISGGAVIISIIGDSTPEEKAKCTSFLDGINSALKLQKK